MKILFITLLLIGCYENNYVEEPEGITVCEAGISCCTDGNINEYCSNNYEKRCNGNIQQKCVDNVWICIMNCEKYDGYCDACSSSEASCWIGF